MPTPSAVTLVNAIADEARELHLAAADRGLGAQLAVVRALADELARHHPSEERMAALQAQLAEELSRLRGLVPGSLLCERHSAGEGRFDPPMDVLLVDDDVSTLHATATIARALGYSCRTADSGEEALQAYTHKPVAIVVSDWNMPGISGLDLCGRIKAHDPRVCAILVTAFHGAERLREVAGRGIDGFLPKPLDIGALEARLRAAEGLIRAMRSLERLRDRLLDKSSVPRC